MDKLPVIILLALGVGLSSCQMQKLYRGGEVTTIYTGNDFSYHYSWYTVEDRTSITFKVRSCSNAIIVLSQYQEYEGPNSTEVILGRYDNTRSIIRNFMDYSDQYETYTPDILHCNEFRSFWIEWGMFGYIRVGTGPYVGEFTFMNWVDKTTHPINAVGITTGYSSSATWQFRENSGHQLFVNTPLDYRYQYMWKAVQQRSFITFEVMACNDVHVALAEEMGRTDFSMYEIVIGGWGNTQSVIRRGAQEAELVKVPTDGIMDCSKHKSFWVSWIQGRIWVGRGTYYGQNPIMNTTDPNPLNVRYLGISTGWGSSGYWIFEDTLQTVTTFATQGNGLLNTTWIESPRKHGLTFNVRACSNAKVILSELRGDQGDNDILIVIAEKDPTNGWVSGVKYPNEVGFLKKVNTTGITSCEEYRPFWLTWWNGTIDFGTGYIYGSNRLFSYQDQLKVHTINSIGFDTYNNQPGEFRFRENAGEVLYLHTPKDFNNFRRVWQTFSPQRMAMVVQIKACSDLHLMLTTSKGSITDEAIDMVIGGWKNTKSVIRTGWRGTLLREKNTPNIMDCNQYKSFWFSWYNGNFRFGIGNLYNKNTTFVVPLQNKFPFNAVGMSTGFGYDGKWRIEEDNGDSFRINTNNTYSYAVNWVNLTGYETLYFSLRACSDGHILLMSDATDIDKPHYEIIIGGWNNTRSAIRTTRRSPDLKANVSSKGILACDDMRPFWVRVKDGLVEVGKGYVYGQQPIMMYKNSETYKINYARFSTGWDGDFGMWQLRNYQGLSAHYESSKDYIYMHWRSVRHQDYVIFDVKACSDVHVSLSPFMQAIGAGYEVVIGGWYNSKSVIRDGGNGKWHYVEQLTPKINNCDAYTRYWISWYNGEISAGKGNVIGRNRFIYWQDLTPRPINAVGFSTGFGMIGAWNHQFMLSRQPEEPVTAVPPPTRTPPAAYRSGLDSGQKVGIAIGVLLAIGLAVLLAYVVAIRAGIQPVDKIKGLVNREVKHERFDQPGQSSEA